MGNEPTINHTIGSRHHLLSKRVIENPTDPVLSLGNLQDLQDFSTETTAIQHQFITISCRFLEEKNLIFSLRRGAYPGPKDEDRKDRKLLEICWATLHPNSTIEASWEVCTMTFWLYFQGFSPSNILHTPLRKEMKNILGGILIKSYCWWFRNHSPNHRLDV